MFDPPDHYYNLSLRLSEVLDDLGVNRRIVMMRRRGYILKETLSSIGSKVRGKNISMFHFGSQSEGSTTLGLQSDMDTLCCSFHFHVIQDWSEWQKDKQQLLMVHDDTTSPGYCLLQAVRPDAPIPKQDFCSRNFRRDTSGRLLLSHSVYFKDGVSRHGPAEAILNPGYQDKDFVPAYWCASWPKEADHWLQQQNNSGWPTEHMKRYAARHGCFVVAVASRESTNQDTEWRISTSPAERCLMLSLNMTQIRCYALMKMILNTYFKTRGQDVISSFMCKTVLFHCIADSRFVEWNDSNLLTCLNRCLKSLFNSIVTENCPHFIMTRNNLLTGKLSLHVKEQLVEIMSALTENLEQSLLGISIDELGSRLHVKSGGMITRSLETSEQISGVIQEDTIVHTSNTLHLELAFILAGIYRSNAVNVYQNLLQCVSKLCELYSVGSRMEQVACHFYARHFCSYIGSTIASQDIHDSQALSQVAQWWLSAGLNSDLSSCRLKQASVLYCAGQSEQSEVILTSLSSQFESNIVLCICGCSSNETVIMEKFGTILQEQKDEEVMKQHVAFCVRFLPCEVNCVPKELKYEFFRSTRYELHYRGKNDFWMDWAVVDSQSYLYFLQYKVYSQSQRSEDQHRALNNMIRTINTEINLRHKETALNLLGQCMEQENRYNCAFRYYTLSLIVSVRHNSAKWHICRLLARLINSEVQYRV